MPSTRRTGDADCSGLTNDYSDDEYDPDSQEEAGRMLTIAHRLRRPKNPSRSDCYVL